MSKEQETTIAMLLEIKKNDAEIINTYYKYKVLLIEEKAELQEEIIKQQETLIESQEQSIEIQKKIIEKQQVIIEKLKELCNEEL